MKTEIQLKWVYEPAAESDGKRLLIDRLWPRGVKKETLRMDGWLKEVAPTDRLRKWFSHDPAKRDEFQKRYRTELSAQPEKWRPLLAFTAKSKVTLLFSARDLEHNNAAVLKDFLEKQSKKRRQHSSKSVRAVN